MKYMEKKNMVLLTVIAVATLLVAVVGATFAYFTAQSATTGNSTTTSATTRELAALSWTAGTDKGESPSEYPGYMAYQSYELAATGNGSANYKLTLDATVDPAFNTIEDQKDLTYSIYKSTTSKPTYTTIFQPGNEDVKTADNTTTYKIAGAGFTHDSLTAVVEDQPLTTGSEQTIVANASINAGATEYYVLVINFHDNGAAQNGLQGKAFSASLKLTAIATGN